MSKFIVVGLLAAVLLGGVALMVLYQADRARTDLPVLGTVGNFVLTDRHGQPFHSGDMLGKLNVVEFFFTSCRGPCPIMNGHFRNIYTAFADAEDVQLISITVDPATDSVPRLAEYADEMGVDDNRWRFLTGPIEEIVRLSEEDFMIAADDLPGNHSTRFILVDRENKIRAYYSGTDEASVDILRTHLQQMLKGGE